MLGVQSMKIKNFNGVSLCNLTVSETRVNLTEDVDD